MGPEEFLNFLERTRQNMEDFKRMKKAFKADLKDQLSHFVLDRFPDLKKSETAGERIEKASEASAIMAFEYVQKTFVRESSNEPYEPQHQAPRVKTRSESELELKGVLKDFPSKHREAMREVHWEEYEVKIKHQQFKKDIHDLIKKTIVEYFEEDIINLSSDNFHYLDDNIYLWSAFPFIDKLYMIKEGDEE